jgi:hypothetical protein
MIRRTVLVSLRAGEHPPVLCGPHFAAVLAEMNGERHELTRSLLGSGTGAGASPGEPAGRGPAARPAPVRHRRQY